MYVVSTIMMMFIILIAIYLSSNYLEQFEQQNVKQNVLVDNNKNVRDSIPYNKELFHQLILILSRRRIIDNTTLDMHGIHNRENTKLYIDPYINHYILNNRQTVAKYNDGIFLCITPRKIDSNDCIWNMENKTVAYNYITDYLFVQAMIKAYRQDITKIKLLKINDSELVNGSQKFDMFITYAVIGSEYMTFLERSLYFINGFIDVDIHRIRAFYPFIKENYKNMREYFSDELMKEYINETNALIPIMQYEIIDLDYVESFITRLELPDDYFDSKINIDKNNTLSLLMHSCYGNKNINNKYECDSPYNYDGTPKTYYSKWDTTCQVDQDCPYFRSNKNYPNKRGGCNKGSCEFPVGIKRLGFTQYEDKDLNSPLCYNCTDMLDLDCCKKQKQPDYVFVNDYDDRESYDMKTVIDKLDIQNY